MDYTLKPTENAFPPVMFLAPTETNEAIEFLKSGSTEFLCPDPLDRQEHEPTSTEPPLFDSDEDADAEEELPLAQAVAPKKRGRKLSVKLLDAKKAVQDSEEDIEESWVQCDRCAKWRKLENQWNKKQFFCSQLGISCEEDCDCDDPPCECNNGVSIKEPPPPQDTGAPQLAAKVPRTTPTRPKKRVATKTLKITPQKNLSEDSHSSDSDSGVDTRTRRRTHVCACS